MTMRSSTDPAPPGPYDELFAWSAHMRATEPVFYDDSLGVWHVFGYADAKRAITEYETFSSEFTTPEEEMSIFSTGNIALMDPPQHRKFRNLVAKAFTPRSVAGLEPRLTRLCAELLDKVPTGRPVDFIEDFASLLTTQVMAELLGIEQRHRHKLREWSDALLSQNRTGMELEPALLAEIARTTEEMDGFLRTELVRRREHPGDDLISGLVRAEVDGERLGDDEVVGIVTIFLVGGHITTTSVLASAAQCLHEHPDALAELRADRSLVPTAVEEIIRYRPPFSRVVRRCTKETRLGDRTVPAGSVVVVWLASGNFDEAVFADAERFVITRTPNPHLGFGNGVHFCLGAPLARLEVRIALNALLDRFERVTLRESAAPPDAYDPFGGILALRKLDVVFEEALPGRAE
ncbi:cytochrome P450 [Streptomyces prasinopilosus]|uniref:Cytochrome P450 n=1 Tax=Streptomyces prasinopilosus TaxID=67344 RepID=A0A1G7AN99_9ACTN|nr:cytochrome P450 [Streptomyces prasinopilosus]SDE16243.1 Cytochrome P450 [Streptomyces prasinopilosus]